MLQPSISYRALFLIALMTISFFGSVFGHRNSAGEFEPFAHEPRHGHDVVGRLAQQACCRGKVAMWGGSYAGFDQWATAKEFPPHLTTIVPAAAAHPPLDYPSLDNVGET